MLRTLLYLLVCLVVGWLFAFMQVPAGWLIGPLLVGVFYRLKIGEFSLPPYVFPFALALIGACIGLTMKVSMFGELAAYFLPLIISLIAILLGAWLLSRVLTRYSTIDPKTALFCCVPGGMSVMLALSQDYKVDQRIVLAFQMARAITIVLAIPILAGLVAGLTGAGSVQTAAPTASATSSTDGSILFPGFNILCVLAIVALALLLAKVVKIPAAQLLYAMLLAFVLNQFIFHIETMPNIVVGIGQALLGAYMGLQFDRAALGQLKKIGWPSVGILTMYLILTFAVSLIFFLLTPLDYVTSMLSMAPGGAPQMSSTAVVLHLDGSIVAAIQLVRLLVIFILLPIIIPILMKKVYSNEKS